jgi:hypothetical protein
VKATLVYGYSGQVVVLGEEVEIKYKPGDQLRVAESICLCLTAVADRDVTFGGLAAAGSCRI